CNHSTTYLICDVLPRSTYNFKLFTYTTLFRSPVSAVKSGAYSTKCRQCANAAIIWKPWFNPMPNWGLVWMLPVFRRAPSSASGRSEEHTSELQSRFELVCRLLLEKKNHRDIN